MEEHDETSFESFQFIDEEIQSLMSEEQVPETGNSFTALLELPPNQAVKLLHSPNAFLSVFPATEIDNSPETTASVLPHSSPNNCNLAKREPIKTDYPHNSSPIFSDPIKSKSNSTKRNDRQKVRSTAKKIKNANGEKLQYIHVRARRGEATDSHSLAERARREKINTRMKLLQELVPGCDKICGTAMVLDKIINHIQSLQHQVEILSMKLAAVQPNIDINIDNLFYSESGSPMESNFAGIGSPSWWVDDVNTTNMVCGLEMDCKQNYEDLIAPSSNFWKADFNPKVLREFSIHHACIHMLQSETKLLPDFYDSRSWLIIEETRKTNQAATAGRTLHVVAA